MTKIKPIIYVWIFLISCLLKAQDIKGTYAIENVEYGLVLRIKDAQSANGTPLVLYRPVNWKCVTWEFQKIGNNTYQLRNLFTGKTFQPKGPNVVPDLPLEQQPISENKFQYYEFLPAGNDSYYIKLAGTELYLTPEASKVNSPIILKNKIWKGDLQKWVIYEQNPTM